ncbi:unnamed protein product [Sphacelaria rigidula]
MWAIIGSRSKASTLMSFWGMAGNTRMDVVEARGLGLSLIDRIVHHHPYSYLGRAVFFYPHGHHLPGGSRSTRRSVVMLRAVGETVVVDTLFLALSVVSDTWDGAPSIAAASLIFSTLELVTELQHYAAEACKDMVARGYVELVTTTTDGSAGLDATALTSHAPRS